MLIYFLIGELWLSLEPHTVDDDVSILLSIDDMERLGIYFDNLNDSLVHASSIMSTFIEKVNGYPFVWWNANMTCMMIAVELRRLRHRFGRPSTYKVMNVLVRSDSKEVDANTRNFLKIIQRNLDACRGHAQKPRCSKFTLIDEKDCSQTIYVDKLYIEGKQILHIVDEAYHHQAACWLENISSRFL